MASALEDLRDQLAKQPVDDELLERYEAECLGASDFEALRLGYQKVIDDADLVRAQGLATRLAELACSVADKSDAPREAAELYLKASELFLEALDDPERSAEALAAAWQSYPDPRILEAVGAMLGRPEDRRAPDYLLMARFQVADEAERTSALHQLAGRKLDRRDLDGAEALFTELKALQGDLETPDGRVERSLQTIARLRSEEQEALKTAKKATKGKKGDAAIEAWTEYAILAQASGDSKLAEETLRKAISLGRSPRAEAGLESLLLKAGRLEELAEVYASIAEQAEGGERVVLRRKLFRLLEELGRPEDAKAQLRLLTEPQLADPSGALEAARAAGEGGDWKKALRVLEEAELAASGKEERLAAMLEHARVLEAELSDLEGAEKVYRRIRVADPRSIPALTFYRRWYEQIGEPRRALSNLAQLYVVLEGDEMANERVSVAAEMARLAAGPLESADRAIDCWRRVLSDDPTNEEANTELRGILEANERWHDLVDHLETWIRALPETALDRRVELLFEIIEVYQNPDKVPLEDMVISTYQRIVALSPANEKAAQGLAKRYEDREQWSELVSLLAKQVEATEDPAELIDIFGQIATLYLDRIRSETHAIPALERVLELDPNNLEIVRRLREIYQRKHDTERLYRTYQRELELVQGADRVDVLVELATLATDDLLRYDEAVGWWRQVLEIDAKHERAVAALQELHAEQEDWPGYVAVLEERLEASKTRKKRVEILQELGEVVYARLADEERALTIFAEICEISPFNTTARNFLQRIYVTRRAWKELLSLYAPREDWKGYISLLGDFATMTKDSALVCDIHLEVARVQEDKLEDPRRVLHSLEAALAAAPERVDVARMLVERYPDNASASKRMTAVEALAQHSEDPHEQLESWRKLAALREQAKDKEGTFDAWAQAVLAAAATGDVQPVKSLEKAAEKAERWEDAVKVISEALGRLPEGEGHGLARVELHRTLGHLTRHRLLDLDAAISHFKWVLQFAPGDEDALDALENIHQSQSDLDGLEEVLKARVEAAKDDKARGDALFKLGEHYESLADTERAAQTFLQVLEEVHEHKEAMAAMRRNYMEIDAWADLAHALEEALTRTQTAKRRQVLRFELGQIYRERLEDYTPALEHYRDLLADPKADEGKVIAELESMLAEGQAVDAVAAVLEQRFRKANAPKRLLEVLERRAAHAEDTDQRLRLLSEIAFIASDVVGDFERAFAAQLERFAWAPDDTELMRELVRLAETSGGFPALVDQMRRIAEDPERVPDRESRNALRLELAKLLTQRFGEIDEPIALYEAVRADSDPVPPDVLLALEGLYELKGDLERLVEVRLAASDALLSDLSRRQKRLDACELLVAELDRVEEALEHYEALLQTDPTDVEVVSRLEPLYMGAERWGDLARLYEQRLAGMGEGPTRDRLRLELAGLQRDQLGELDKAIDELIELIGSESVGEQARELLFAVAKDVETPDKRRARILKGLDAYYEDEGTDPTSKAELLLVHAMQAKAGPARARVLREAAQLLKQAAEGEADPERPGARRAFSLYARALSEYPGDREALEALTKLAGQLGLWDVFIQVAASCADKADVPAVAHVLWQAEARAAEEELRDPKKAIAAWEKLAESAKAASGDAFKALDALDRLYQQTGDDAARIKVLRRKRAATRKPTVRMPLLSEEARLLANSGRRDEAMVTLKAVLEQTAASARGDMLDARKTAIKQLSAMHREAEQWPELVDHLTSAAEDLRAKDSKTSTEILREAAEVVEKHLDDRKRAIEIYERILEAEEKDVPTLRALDRLYQADKRWADKARVLAALVEQADDVAERDKLLFTLAQLYGNVLQRQADAVECYRRLLERDPSFVPAHKVLSTYGNKSDSLGRTARRVLADAHRRGGEAEKLRAVLEQSVKLEAEADTTSDDLAHIYEELVELAGSDSAKAWEHAAAAYCHGPAGDNGIRRRDKVLALVEQSGARDKLAAVLNEASRFLDTKGARIERREMDLATLEGMGATDDELKPIWRALVEDDPRHAVAMEGLERSARSSEDPADLVALLRVREAGARDDAERVKVRLELAAAYRSVPGGGDDAATVYESILAEAPDHRESFEKLEALYGELERHEDVVELLERRIDAIDNKVELAKLKVRQARTYWQQLGEPDRAVGIFAEVLEANSYDRDALVALETMWTEELEQSAVFAILEPQYIRSEDWPQLAALYESAAASSEDTGFALDVLDRLSNLQLDKLNTPTGAYESMKLAVERADWRPDYRDRLEELAEKAVTWGDLADFYEGHIEAEASEDLGLVRRLAELVETKLEDAERAIRWHTRALELDEGLTTSREALVRLYEAGEQWEELAALLGETARVALDVGDKVAAYRRQAELMRQRLGEPRRAVVALNQIAELDPENDEVNEEIAGLLEELGDLEALHDHFRRCIERARSPEIAGEYQMRLAASLAADPHTLAASVEELGELLKRTPEDEGARRALMAILGRAEEAEAADESFSEERLEGVKKAADLLERALGDAATPAQQASILRARLRAKGDPAERRKAMRSLADLYRAGGALKEALRCYGEALAGKPDDAELRDKVAELGAEGELHEELARVWEAAVEAAGKKKKLADDYKLRLAEVLAGPLVRLDRAAPWLEDLFPRHQGEPRVLAPLAEWYRRSDRAPKEAEVLESWLAVVQGDQARRLELSRRLGILRMDRLGDTAGARGVLEATLPEGAADAEVASRLEKLIGRAQDFEGLARLYEASLSHEVPEAQRVQLLSKKAQIHEVRLQDLDTARDCCQEILALQPDNRFALTSLMRIQRARGDFAALDALLEAHLAAAAQGQKAQLLSERALLNARELKRPDKALELAREADGIAGFGPGPDPLVEALTLLLEAGGDHQLAAGELVAGRYEARDRFEEMARVQALRSKASEQPDRKVALALSAADAAGQCGVWDEAYPALCEALAAGPDNRELRSALSEAGAALEDFAPLLEAAEALPLEALGPEVSAAIQAWLGGVHRDGLEDADAAIEAFEKALELAPESEEIMLALDGLYRQTRRSDKLKALLQRRVSGLDESQRPAALIEMADTLAEEDGPGAALDVLAEVLALRPTEPEVVSRLEGMLGHSEIAARVAELLAGPYRAEQRWDELITVLGIVARHAASGERRGTLLSEIGDICDSQLSDERRAFDFYVRAIEEDPGSREILRRVARIAMKLQLWAPYADLLERVAAKVEEDKTKRDLLLQVSQLYEIKLAKPDRAIDTLKAVIELDEGHRGALAGLRRLYLKLEQLDELVAVTRRAAAAAVEPKEALAAWAEVYDLASRLGDTEGMIAACEASLDLDPYDQKAAVRLVPLYESTGRYDEMEKLLLTQAEGAQDTRRVAAIMLSLGRVRLEALKDVDGAVEAFERAWKLEANEAGKHLERFYREGDDWSRLYRLLSTRVERMGDSVQKAQARKDGVETLLEMAEIAERQLDDRNDAIAAYERVLALDPTNERAMNELIRIFHRADRPERLVELYEAKAEHVSKGERATFLVLAAELRASRLDQIERGAELVEQALKLDPHNAKALSVKAKIAAVTGKPEDAAKMLEAQLAEAKGNLRFDVLLSLGRLYHRRLDRTEDALRLLLEARQIQPTSADLKGILREVLEQSGSWAELKDLLEQDFEAAKSRQDKAERALAIARLCLDHMDDEQGFLEWAGKANEAKPDSKDVAEAYVGFYSDREQWDQLAPKLEWLVNYMEGKKLTRDLPSRAHELGQLMERLGRADKALEYYKTAMVADGSYIPNLVDYGRLLIENKQWERAMKVNQNLLLQSKHIDDADLVAQILFNLAQAGHQLGEDKKAKQWLKKLLAQAPEHQEAQKLLSQLG